jgi:hypothetical protein
MDHASWKKFATEERGSSNTAVVWREKNLPDGGYSMLTEDDFELFGDLQPATKGASDGNAAGASLKKLPTVNK